MKKCAKITMLSLLLVFGIMLMVPINQAMAGTTHLVFGTVVNSDGVTKPAQGDLQYNAYIKTRPLEVLTQASLPGYDGTTYGIDTGNFTTNWAAGEILVINFLNLTILEGKTVEVTLTNAGVDEANVQLAALTPTSLNITPVNPTVQVPSTQQFTATATFTGVDGNQNVTSKATWQSSDNDKGTINAAGLFTPNHVGTTNITATLGGVTSNTSTVTVTAGPLATLTVSPNTASLTADQTQQFTVSGVDVNGNTASLGTITWSVQGGIGTINAAGLFTATTVGTGTVTATSSLGPSDSSGTITVAAGALVTLTVSPDTATRTADQTQQFTAAGVDADGNAANVGTITWSVQGGIGTINAAGLFTATTVGTGTVTATSSLGKTDTSGTITVTPGAAARMTLAATNTTLASDGKGSTVLTATILDQNGNVCTNDNSTVVTFSLTDGTYLTLSSATKTAVAGVATVTLTTKAGTVPSPPATAGVNITSGSLTPPAATPDLTITIVNFSATPQYSTLVTSGTPNTTTITAIGATNYTWSKVSGNGTLSGTGATVTFTAPNNITEGTAGHSTVIRVQDTNNPAVKYDLTIKTYAPVQITQPAAAVGITHNGTLKTTQLQVSGGSGSYSYEVTDASVNVITVNTTGLVTGIAKGTKTVTVWDATLGAKATVNGFRAVTPNIEVVDAVAVTPATANLQASGTQQFAATGGKGGYVWSVSNPAAGTINAAGLFTAAKVTANQTATITATDGTYSNIKGTAAVTVFQTLAITDKPATSPTILYGNSREFNVGGGDGSYTWTVSGPVPVTGGADSKFTFKAPDTGAFAGEYTITVADGKGFTDSFKIKVPIALDPPNWTFKAGDPAKLLTVKGAASTYTWDILSASDMAKVFTPADYGTWGKASPVADDATNTFTPASVTQEKTFYIQITVGDNQALAAAGLNKNVFGPFRIIPVADYTVNVKKSDGTALSGALVAVNYTGKAPVTTGGDGKAVFTNLPDTGGTYIYNVSLAGYISQAISSSLKTVNVTLKAVDAAKAIKGTVTPLPGTSGATVTAFIPTDLATQYSGITAGDGTYTINLPAGAAAQGWTVVASKTGYTAVTQTGKAAGATGVDFTLAPITGTAPDAGAGGGGQTETANGQTATVQVPAGGLTTDGFIIITQKTKVSATSSFTSASPTYIYDVKVTSDAAGTTPLAAANIKRIVITLPIDLSVLEPGDLEKGVYSIYKAETREDLEEGNGKAVDKDNIIATDYVGDGQIGSVTFWVSDLTVLGIGEGAGEGGTTSTSGCFIATAAYGSYLERHVEILRNFRDLYLLTNDWGRAFVGFYYRHSPALANFIAKNDGLRAVVRLGLAPVVGIAYVALHTTPLQKVLIVLLLIGIMTAGLAAIRRMRGYRRSAG